jgi:hypothetical protein
MLQTKSSRRTLVIAIRRWTWPKLQYPRSSTNTLCQMFMRYTERTHLQHMAKVASLWNDFFTISVFSSSWHTRRWRQTCITRYVSFGLQHVASVFALSPVKAISCSRYHISLSVSAFLHLMYENNLTLVEYAAIYQFASPFILGGTVRYVVS